MPGTYHSRRKSGQGLPTNTSMTDVRKAMGAEKRQRSSGSTSKRSKEQQPTTYKLGRSPKEREREYYEYADDGDGRDTFPQYCMACEKQFLPVDDRCLYCSEACREFDENSFRHAAPPRGSASSGFHHQSTSSSTSSLYAPSSHHREPKDIIPRASPSRPTSTYFASSPAVPGDATAAISALRSLTIRSGSPPSPTSMGEGVGSSLWPFTRSAASPEVSYPRGGFSTTYDGAYTKRGYSSSGTHGGYSSHYSTSGMDRPLPSRRPGGYSRPKSIELVTPMVGR